MFQALFGTLPPRPHLEAQVRVRLSQSLAYVIDKAGPYLAFDQARMFSALECIRRSRQNPGVFARYYDLIFAITSNRFEDANALIAQIADLAQQPVVFEILSYDKANLGDDFERYQRLIFAESQSIGPLEAPSPQQFETSAGYLTEALQTIRTVDPSIYDDIQGLFSKLYVAGDEQPNGSFGGVTSFMVWGASFMNIKAYRTRVDAVQFLVHEVTHGLLFALSCDEPLVLNPVSESYRSPLRTDLRPMDGIYHATLVCARLAAFNRAWLASGIAEANARDEVIRQERNATAAFLDGAHTVAEHGKLSRQGRELLERCRSGLAAAE